MSSKDARYTDLNSLAKEQKDFVRRTLSPKTYNSLLYLMAFFALITPIFLNLTSYYTDGFFDSDKFFDVSNLKESFISLNAISSYVFIFMVALVLYHMKTVNDSVFYSEFENALFAGALNSGVEMAFIVQKNGHIVYFNSGCSKYIPLQQKSSSDGFQNMLKSLGLNEQQSKVFLGALYSGQKAELNMRIKSIDGEDRDLVLIIRPIMRPSGYFVFKAVNKNEAGADDNSGLNFLCDVLDALPIGAYGVKKNGVIFHVNSVFETMLEQNKDSIIGKNISEIVSTIDATSLQKRVFEGEASFKKNIGTYEKLLVKQFTLSGNWRSFPVRCGLINKPSSDWVAPSGRWDRIFANSPISISIVRDDLTIINTNNSFSSFIGKKNHQISGRKLTDIIEKNDIDGVLDLFNKAKTNKIKNSDFAQVNFIGVENTAAALYLTAFGEGFVAYFIDISEQKNLEQRFVHSQKMQAVGQLAGGIAHDFNNLLTAIMGFCDLLLQRHSPGDHDFSDIMQIKQNSNRAANLVRQLLAFSRKQTLCPDIVDVTDSIAELSNLMRRLIGENIKLSVNYGRDLWKVRVDQGQLEQVLVNLAVNARDAMTGSGELSLQTKNIIIDDNYKLSPNLITSAEDNDLMRGEYVLIEIMDTGCGMSKEIMSKIFEPFFTTKDVGEGTGLGLSTVYGIIRQTGGHIYVSSIIDSGTKFSIFLNRYIETEEDLATKENSEVKELSKDLTGQGVVLLVEDEDPVRMFCSSALKNKGYSVLEADCGEVALSLIKEHKGAIDIIITDVMMPGMTGTEMVKEVLDDYPDMSVIFISGYAEDAFVNSFGDEREFNFLPKPFTLNQLAGKVKDVMDKKNS